MTLLLLTFIFSGHRVLSQDFISASGDNKVQFSKAGTFRYKLVESKTKPTVSCQLNLEDQDGRSIGIVPLLITENNVSKPAKMNPIGTDTLTIPDHNTFLSVSFRESENGPSVESKLTGFKWMDATKYKARLTWTTSSHNQMVMDVFEVRTEKK
ncbi:MAG: hypothetical protein NT126_12390 [Bacteroidetes bacterium]|nr:hypothetical protein [Bacteroidota bacterium]